MKDLIEIQDDYDAFYLFFQKRKYTLLERREALLPLTLHEAALPRTSLVGPVAPSTLGIGIPSPPGAPGA